MADKFKLELVKEFEEGKKGDLIMKVKDCYPGEDLGGVRIYEEAPTTVQNIKGEKLFSGGTLIMRFTKKANAYHAITEFEENKYKSYSCKILEHADFDEYY